MQTNRFKGLRALAIENPNKTDHLPIEVSNELLDDCLFINMQAELRREMIKSFNLPPVHANCRSEIVVPKSNRINPDGAPPIPVSKVLSEIKSLRDRVRDYWNW